jgi:hypothetical protein
MSQLGEMIERTSERTASSRFMGPRGKRKATVSAQCQAGGVCFTKRWQRLRRRHFLSHVMGTVRENDDTDKAKRTSDIEG